MEIVSVDSFDIDELQAVYLRAFQSNAAFAPQTLCEEEADDDKELSPIVALKTPGKTVLAFALYGEIIGGSVLSLGKREDGYVNLFFIKPEQQGQGFGTEAWRKIEQKFCCIHRWTLRTPTYLMRNIAFYVNKCDFSIIKVEDLKPDGFGMYVFRKNITKAGRNTMSVMREKMHTGELYLPDDEEITEWQTKCLDRLYEFNMTRPTEFEKRQTMLKEMFAEIGENCYIEPPFHSNFGGSHVHFGNNIYANFNLTCVDDTHIYVGDHTMFGPNVTIATAGHPILPELREQAYQYNAPVHIGKNCWIGAGVVILPGITIGDNVVVGAGSVVTKDLRSNVVAVGNPCKVYPEKKNIPKNRNKWHRKGKRFREIRDKILDAIWYNYYAGIA